MYVSVWEWKQDFLLFASSSRTCITAKIQSQSVVTVVAVVLVLPSSSSSFQGFVRVVILLMAVRRGDGGGSLVLLTCAPLGGYVPFWVSATGLRVELVSPSESWGAPFSLGFDSSIVNGEPWKPWRNECDLVGQELLKYTHLQAFLINLSHV